MTANIVVTQPNRGCIHVATDAAIYSAEEAITAFSTKVTTIPHMPAVITSMGNAGAHVLFGNSLAKRYATFDEMIRYAECELPDLHAAYELPNGASVVIAGISKERGPEAYMFQTETIVPPMNTREELDAHPLYDVPFKFVKLPTFAIMSPVPPSEMSIAANYEGIDVDADEASIMWSIRKVMNMQRQMALPQGSFIGGHVEVTTVSADGIMQRVIERWTTDKLGNAARPAPIDWKQWHRENPKPGTNVSNLHQLRAVR